VKYFNINTLLHYCQSALAHCGEPEV